VENFNTVFDEFIKNEAHLILMDINLTTYDGFYWCSKIREVSKVLFPGSTNGKINALLRRTYDYTSPASNIIEHSGVILKLKDNTVMYQAGKLELTKNEFKILYTLMKDKGDI